MTALMTTKERIIAAIRREPVDRVPICPRIAARNLGYPDNGVLWMMDIKKKRYSYDPHIPLYSPANLALFKDAWPVMPYIQDVNVRQEVKEEGTTLRVTSVFETPAGKVRQVRIWPKPGQAEFGTNPNPHIAEYMIKNTDDLEKVKYLLPPVSTFGLADFFALEKLYGDECILMPSIHGIFDHTGGNLCEMTQLMVAYYEDRPFFDAVIKVFAQFSMDQLTWALDHGVRHFFLAWFYESLSTGWSPQIYREVFLPVIKRQVAMIHVVKGLACFYDDGRLMDILPLLIEAGVDCVETCTPAPMGDFNIAEAKKRYGRQIAFKGGIDVVNVLWKGTPELIDRTIREYMETGAGGSGLLIGTCDSIRPETPRQNVDAFFEAANKYAGEFARQTA